MEKIRVLNIAGSDIEIVDSPWGEGIPTRLLMLALLGRSILARSVAEEINKHCHRLSPSTTKRSNNCRREDAPSIGGAGGSGRTRFTTLVRLDDLISCLQSIYIIKITNLYTIKCIPRASMNKPIQRKKSLRTIKKSPSYKTESKNPCLSENLRDRVSDLIGVDLSSNNSGYASTNDKSKKKKRSCLKCRGSFTSNGNHNRLCGSCAYNNKSRSFRSGDDYSFN